MEGTLGVLCVHLLFLIRYLLGSGLLLGVVKRRQTHGISPRTRQNCGFDHTTAWLFFERAFSCTRVIRKPRLMSLKLSLSDFSCLIEAAVLLFVGMFVLAVSREGPYPTYACFLFLLPLLLLRRSVMGSRAGDRKRQRLGDVARGLCRGRRGWWNPHFTGFQASSCAWHAFGAAFGFCVVRRAVLTVLLWFPVVSKPPRPAS